MNRATLKVDGMTCGHCVVTVKNALEDIVGVNVEKVVIGTATVSYDPAIVSPETIAEAVSETGYTAALAA